LIAMTQPLLFWQFCRLVQLVNPKAISRFPLRYAQQFRQ